MQKQKPGRRSGSAAQKPAKVKRSRLVLLLTAEEAQAAKKRAARLKISVSRFAANAIATALLFETQARVSSVLKKPGKRHAE